MLHCIIFEMNIAAECNREQIMYRAGGACGCWDSSEPTQRSSTVAVPAALFFSVVLSTLLLLLLLQAV
jgi:hypothetical protein